jgi:23S rRNA pseudouridine2605 synthase
MNEEHNTLLKTLMAAGAGSRRKLAELIQQGKVQVNNIRIEDFKYPVDPAKDIISIKGKKLNLSPQQSLSVVLHKPAGVLSTTTDERGRKTVIDILPPVYRNKGLYPAGRLDKDSTGLLILTNDGELTYKLTHPRFEHEKEYYVHIDSDLTHEERKKLGKGIMLDDGMTYPARVKQIKTSPPYNYSITIHEGRNRQVRRMFSELGHVIFALKRVRIGSLMLGNLEEGKSRKLTPSDIRKTLNF